MSAPLSNHFTNYAGHYVVGQNQYQYGYPRKLIAVGENPGGYYPRKIIAVGEYPGGVGGPYRPGPRKLVAVGEWPGFPPRKLVAVGEGPIRPPRKLIAVGEGPNGGPRPQQPNTGFDFNQILQILLFLKLFSGLR